MGSYIEIISYVVIAIVLIICGFKIFSLGQRIEKKMKGKDFKSYEELGFGKGG